MMKNIECVFTCKKRLTQRNKTSKLSLSTGDIERDRGKPLSVYERNVIIYDWLYKVEEIPQ